MNVLSRRDIGATKWPFLYSTSLCTNGYYHKKKMFGQNCVFCRLKVANLVAYTVLLANGVNMRIHLNETLGERFHLNLIWVS